MTKQRMPIYTEASPKKAVDHVEIPSDDVVEDKPTSSKLIPDTLADAIMDGKPISTSEPVLILPLEERMLAQQKTLIAARDQLRLQLNGVENQLFIVDELLNPEPVEAPPDDQVPSEQDQRPPPEKGTI